MIQITSIVGLISGVVLGLMIVLLFKYSRIRPSSPQFHPLYLLLSTLSLLAGSLSLLDMVLSGLSLGKLIATIMLLLAGLLLFSRSLKIKGY